MTPSYVFLLVPQTISNISQYNLKNSDNLQTINARTAQYVSSFLPSAARYLNNIPAEAAESDSLTTFKKYLNRDILPVPKCFYTWTRRTQILDTRLRTNCSSLNNDLFLKNVTNFPLCRCGNIETTQHFFCQCHFYHEQKAEHLDSISHFANVSLNATLPCRLRQT